MSGRSKITHRLTTCRYALDTEFDEVFKQWIMDFPKNELPIVYELLDRYKGEKSIYVFYSRADIEDYLSKTFG